MPSISFKGLDPISQSECVATYQTDFSDLTQNSMVNTEISKPYLSVLRQATAPINSGLWALQTLTLPNIDSSFGPVKSIGFLYRPWYQLSSKLDYLPITVPGTLHGEAMDLYTPSVILHNKSTLETIFIRPNRNTAFSIMVSGVTKSYQPLSINVQGRIGFYASLRDQVELMVVSPTGGNTFGKLILNLFNFDSHNWYQTTNDAAVPIT